MTRLRTAIIGCGWVADSHAEEGFLALPNQFDLAVACDIDPMRASTFAERHGIAQIETSFEAVLARPDIDVVSICTPPSLHFAMTMAAMDAGKHVICEKPFVHSLAAADRIIAHQQTVSARVMPIFQYRFGTGINRVRHVIHQGLAGRGYVHAVETAWKRGPDYYEVAWRGKFATELGGVLLTQSIHMHDMMMSLIGPAEAVAGFRSTRVNPIEVEDCAVASLRMADGSLVSLTATLGSQKQITRMRFCFENVTFEIDTGRLADCGPDSAGRPGDPEWLMIPKTPEIGAAIQAAMDSVPEETAPRFARQFAGFHAALASGAAFPLTLADARRSLELITAIFHANETGTTVQLPIGPEHPKYEGWVPTQAGEA
jgi:predicted dehydrogenase